MEQLHYHFDRIRLISKASLTSLSGIFLQLQKHSADCRIDNVIGHARQYGWRTFIEAKGADAEFWRIAGNSVYELNLSLLEIARDLFGFNNQEQAEKRLSDSGSGLHFRYSNKYKIAGKRSEMTDKERKKLTERLRKDQGLIGNVTQYYGGKKNNLKRYIRLSDDKICMREEFKMNGWTEIKRQLRVDKLIDLAGIDVAGTWEQLWKKKMSDLSDRFNIDKLGWYLRNRKYEGKKTESRYRKRLNKKELLNDRFAAYIFCSVSADGKLRIKRNADGEIIEGRIETVAELKMALAEEGKIMRKKGIKWIRIKLDWL